MFFKKNTMYLYPISNSKETQFQNSKKKITYIFKKKWKMYIYDYSLLFKKNLKIYERIKIYKYYKNIKSVG